MQDTYEYVIVPPCCHGCPVWACDMRVAMGACKVGWLAWPGIIRFSQAPTPWALEEDGVSNSVWCWTLLVRLDWVTGAL